MKRTSGRSKKRLTVKKAAVKPLTPRELADAAGGNNGDGIPRLTAACRAG